MNELLEEEFIKKGCSNRKENIIARQVYLELCEVKRYWDVESFYSNTLEKIYFSARREKSDEFSYFIPIAESETLSFNRLVEILQKLETQRVYIAIVHADSTCVYYQITDGLAEPPKLRFKNMNIDEKRTKLDIELKKNRTILEQAALMGVTVTISKKRKELKLALIFSLGLINK